MIRQFRNVIVKANGDIDLLPVPGDERRTRTWTIDYGPTLIDCREEPDGFVCELDYRSRQPVPELPFEVHKREYALGQFLYALREQRRGQLALIGDRELVIEGATSAMIGPVYSAKALDAGVLVQLHNTSEVGQRSIFLYGYDGKEIWRVAYRDEYPELGYMKAYLVDDGNVRAIMEHGGRAYSVSIRDGTILGSQWWKE